jgi:hypothetical protein
MASSEAGPSAGLLVRVETAVPAHYAKVNGFEFNGMYLASKGTVQGTTDTEAVKNKQILHQWNGDYPLLALNLLPAGLRETPVGYIGDAEAFKRIWQAFKPKARMPEVNFGTDLVVFARNVQFYNNTTISAVKVRDGVLEVVAIETMSSRPIKENVAFAIAVVGREGVTSLKIGNEALPIPPRPEMQRK